MLLQRYQRHLQRVYALNAPIVGSRAEYLGDFTAITYFLEHDEAAYLPVSKPSDFRPSCHRSAYFRATNMYHVAYPPPDITLSGCRIYTEE